MSDTTTPTPTPTPMPAASLISIPADPTRTYALQAYWQGSALPYFSWSGLVWQATSDATCLFQSWTPGGDGWLYARVVLPTADAEYALRLMALDMSGNPISTEDVETIVPP